MTTRLAFQMLQKNKIIFSLLIVASALCLSGCASDSEKVQNWIDDNYTLTSTMELDNAKLFRVDYLNDGYGFITINDEDYYLVVPDGEEVPKVVDGLTVIQRPLSNIFVVGSGSMDFFIESDSLDRVSFCSLEKEDWELDEVREAMESGSMTFAGKYSAPDYELLLNEGCDLIVENTMITHTPEVLIQLQKLGFATMVDHSSYEASVQGRMEWIKLYGYLCDNTEVAEKIYNDQIKLLEDAKECASNIKDKKSVGFFSITAANTVSIRKADDYVVDMIELAGGKYAFNDLEGVEGSGSTTIQMEAFYKVAKDCDVLIYNGTIEGDISSIDDLILKNELLANAKAVKDGEVYCASGSFYQSAMDLGVITSDISKILNEQDDLTYLVKLK